jgi:hypothetical protein
VVRLTPKSPPAKAAMSMRVTAITTSERQSRTQKKGWPGIMPGQPFH